MVGKRCIAPVLCAGAFAAVSLRSRPAAACHTGEQIGRALFSALAVGIDIPLTIHDLVVDDSSKGYAIGEVVVAGGLAAGSIALAVPRTCDEGGQDYPTASRNERMFMAGMATWNIALVAHGIYVLVTPKAKPTNVALVPLSLEGIDGQSVGLGVAGRF